MSSSPEQRIDRIERILIARGIATEWDMNHNPDAQENGKETSMDTPHDVGSVVQEQYQYWKEQP